MTGFINLYKKQGLSSFEAVKRLRFLTGEKKAGHCGTLDPEACGVLPIMLGGATKFLEFLPDRTKEYRAVMRLGTETDTLDIWGRVLRESKVEVGVKEVKAAAESFKGDIMQLPPMYSAIKKNGVRLYSLARKGLEIERSPRPAAIFSIRAEACGSEGDYELFVKCSSGTYIRSLIDDIGKKLGCGAVMLFLERLSACGFEKKDSVELCELEQRASECSLKELLYPVDAPFSSYGSLFVTEAQARRFSNGGGLSLDRLAECKVNELYRVYSQEGAFLGLGFANAELRELEVKRVLVER